MRKLVIIGGVCFYIMTTSCMASDMINSSGKVESNISIGVDERVEKVVKSLGNSILKVDGRNYISVNDELTEVYLVDNKVYIGDEYYLVSKSGMVYKEKYESGLTVNVDKDDKVAHFSINGYMDEYYQLGKQVNDMYKGLKSLDNALYTRVKNKIDSLSIALENDGYAGCTDKYKIELYTFSGNRMELVIYELNETTSIKGNVASDNAI